MSRYAIKFDEDDDWKLLEQVPGATTWKVLAKGDDLDELADEVFELIEDDELDAGQLIPVVRPAGRSERRAVSFCTPEQRRQLGYVIDDRPAMGRQRDQHDG
jgi:hypothetical protein